MNKFEFDEMFTYEGKDLGCQYSKNETVLKVWAPTCNEVKCHILKDGKEQLMDMTKEDKGVYSLVLEGDYEGASYVYHVHFDDKVNIATDPYARASTANHERTVIIDLEKTKIDSKKDNLKQLKSYTDAIIYELHVRDFSMDEHSGLEPKGKFNALTKEGVKTVGGELSGLDYLADLGITHVQLLPVYDFGSVDEENQFDSYNWGYDPVQYNVPEGSYGSDVEDPYSRILELKKVIAAMHAKGLRVIMDVVYNHMYDRDASAFEKIVPGYYFRTDDEGNVSNGSFCGNDVDSTRPMVKQFLLESTRIWIEEYGFDGFRFDLMGVLDIETMNLIAEQTKAIDDNAMIYGEGWNMPTFLDDSEKATMMNHDKMPLIAHFSDIFREKIKGGTLDDKFSEGGFGSGDLRKSIDAMHLLLGTVMPVENEGNHIEPYFSKPSHTVNYVECHDNHTLWDKLSLSLGDEALEIKKYRHRFITTMVLISQGIPFLHAGQEFFRSKNGEHNSYKSSDEINMFRWNEKDANLDNVKYIKDVIEFRKKYDELRLTTKDDIEKLTHVYTENDLVVYEIDAYEGKDYEKIIILINAKTESVVKELEEGYVKVLGREGACGLPINEPAIVEPLAVEVYVR